MGKRSTILPEATLRNSGLVRSGLLSLLAVPGLGLLQLTSGTTIGTAIASPSEHPESPLSNPQPPPPPSSTITANTVGRCGVNFLFPKGKGLEFYHLDTINVTYQSSFANPTLHCWCRSEPGSDQVTERESSLLHVLSMSPYLQEPRHCKLHWRRHARVPLPARTRSPTGLLIFSSFCFFGRQTRACIIAFRHSASLPRPVIAD